MSSGTSSRICPTFGFWTADQKNRKLKTVFVDPELLIDILRGGGSLVGWEVINLPADASIVHVGWKVAFGREEIKRFKRNQLELSIHSEEFPELRMDEPPPELILDLHYSGDS